MKRNNQKQEYDKRHEIAAEALLRSLGINLHESGDSETQKDTECGSKYEKEHDIYIPFIRSKAKRWSAKGAGEYEDLVQVGRIQLFKAIKTYEPTKGTLKTYLSFILDNKYRAIKAHAMAQSRVPHIWELSATGEWSKRPYHVKRLEDVFSNGEGDIYDAISSNISTAEDIVDQKQAHIEFAKFKMKLFNRMDKRQKDVYKCLTSPSATLVMTARNSGSDEVTIPIIALYLGLTKNQVDYSLLKIRNNVDQIVSEMSQLQIDTIRRCKL